MEQKKDTVSSHRRLALGLVVAVVFLAALACNGTSLIAFTAKRLDSEVFTGASSGSMTPLTNSAAESLPTGHRVSTDSTGQALLEGQLSTNKTCRIYVFQSSSLTMKACPRSSYQGTNTATCQEENTAVYKQCKGNVQMTPSGEVEVVGSWLSLTYLPDQQLTLVMVAEGAAEVSPVDDFREGTLGEPILVEAQQFVYTAPQDMLREIADLPPRTPLSLEELPPLVEALEIEPWIERVIDRARQDNVPFPEPEPPPPPPPQAVFVVRGAGGPLGDLRVQEATAIAVDWMSILIEMFPDEEPIALLEFPDLVVTTDQVPFDPERSRAMLAEAGYPEGFPVLVLVSEKDDWLVEVAKWVGDFLSKAGLNVKLRVEPPENVPVLIEEFKEFDAPLLWLAWE